MAFLDKDHIWPAYWTFVTTKKYAITLKQGHETKDWRRLAVSILHLPDTFSKSSPTLWQTVVVQNFKSVSSWWQSAGLCFVVLSPSWFCYCSILSLAQWTLSNVFKRRLHTYIACDWLKEGQVSNSRPYFRPRWRRTKISLPWLIGP